MTVTLLALLAAFLFALAAYLQQRTARSTTPKEGSTIGRVWALMSTLVQQPIWLLGWLVNLAGFGSEGLALHLGSVPAVQPLLATQLMFALPMSSFERRQWPRLRDWAGAVSICAGLAVLLLFVVATPLEGTANRGRVLVAVAIVATVIVVGVPLAARISANVLCVVAATCAGLSFALTAVFIKLTTDELSHRGVASTATDWVGYSLIASTVAGLVLAQLAFANGPLPWAVAIKESVSPVSGFTIGVLAFPFALATDATTLIALAGSGLLLVLGAVLLAASPSADLWLTREDTGEQST